MLSLADCRNQESYDERINHLSLKPDTGTELQMSPNERYSVSPVAAAIPGQDKAVTVSAFNSSKQQFLPLETRV